MAYADWDFYTGTYKGVAIAQTDFPRLVLRASAVIDQVTFGRAVEVVDANEDAETIELICMATCAVAEEYQVLDKSTGSGGEIASEKVGSHSVSYVQNATAQMSDDAKLARAARLYLGQTGLMYQGIFS